MTTTSYELPVIAQAQQFYVRLSGVDYFLTLRWNTAASVWMLSIADDARMPLVSNIPLITGRDLLNAHRAATGIPGALVADTDYSAGTPPTEDNLGITGHLYYIV